MCTRLTTLADEIALGLSVEYATHRAAAPVYALIGRVTHDMRRGMIMTVINRSLVYAPLPSCRIGACLALDFRSHSLSKLVQTRTAACTQLLQPRAIS